MSAVSAAVHTAWTPAFANAALGSIERMRPCAKFERTTRMCSCRGNEMSAAKRPRPVSSGRSSSRGTDRPTNFSFGFASGGAIGLPDLAGFVWASAAHLRGGRAYRLHDALIAGAAAQIGREHVDEVVIADVRLAFQHAGDQHEKAWCAEAALQAVMLH